MGILTLLTDFGLEDYYVAAVKGVVLSTAPGTTLVDISHQVPAGDLETGAFLLRAAVPSFPAGTVHLAVVDPGVGSDRRLLVVRQGEATFVAPDNGLLTPFLDGAAVWSAERHELFRDLASGVETGHTFHGRDRFAPLAAALLNGATPAALGRPIDDPVRLVAPAPQRRGDELLGRVIHIDRFGNLVTDLPAGWLPPGAFEAEVAGRRTDVRVDHYRQLPAGRAGVLTGSLATLELSLRDASLAERWGVERGAAVRIRLAATIGEEVQ